MAGASSGTVAACSLLAVASVRVTVTLGMSVLLAGSVGDRMEDDGEVVVWKWHRNGAGGGRDDSRCGGPCSAAPASGTQTQSEQQNAASGDPDEDDERG